MNSKWWIFNYKITRRPGMTFSEAWSTPYKGEPFVYVAAIAVMVIWKLVHG